MRTAVALLPVLLAACGPTRAPVAEPVRAEPVLAATNLRVDHAWVKDAAKPDEQAARRQSMDALRERAARGEGFGAAWSALHLDPEPWHVGEGETYPYDVLPEAARSLPVGALSPVVPGNGGLHLFRILGREPAE